MPAKKLLIPLLSLIITLWLANCSYSAVPAGRQEMRAMWVTRFQMDSPKKIEKFIQSAKTNGINTLFVQVIGRGQAYYDSSVIPKVDLDFDPLKLAVEKSHSEGIKIHAWINTYYAWSNSSPPAQKEHVANKYPGWMIKVGNSKFIDPANKDGRKYLAKVFDEVAKKYDVDGLHMDYIRYPSEISALNLLNKKMFKELSLIDPEFIVKDRALIKEIFGPAAFIEMNEKWIELRCGNVTGLVEEVSASIKKIRPGIKLSAAVFPDIEQAKKDNGQNWPLWLESGIVDFVVPMVYSGKLERVTKLMRDIVGVTKGDNVIIGLGAYMNTSSQLAKQLRTYKRFQKYYPMLQGFCLFSYDSISAKPFYLEKLKKYVF